jgi:hypothetical protein
MASRFFLMFTLALFPLAVAGCSSDEPADAGGDVAKEDIVRVSDLLVQSADGAGAIKIGDPAELLGLAKSQSNVLTARTRAALQYVEAIAQGRDPGRRGKTPAGLPFGVWTGVREGVEAKLIAVKLTDSRVRYLLLAHKAGDPGAFKPLLTGVFVRKAAERGGGRLHVNLTNTSDLLGGDADGVLQVTFANLRDDRKVRRLAYRNLTLRGGDATPRNFSADYVYQPGVGGRFRIVGVGELVAKLDGPERFAMRVKWTPAGGRADALVTGGSPPATFHASECWGPGGLRTAYASEAVDPGEEIGGDVGVCAGYPLDEVPASSAAADAQEPEPDAAADLADTEASSITEAEADEALDPAL